MQDLSAYLRNLKERLGIRTNGELAAQLHLDEQRVSKWYEGEEIPDDDTCIKIAFMAGDDPANVLILKHLAASSTMTRAFWEEVSIKYRYGRTFPQSFDKGRSFDRRQNVLKFNGAERRTRADRRRGIDRRFALAI